MKSVQESKTPIPLSKIVSILPKPYSSTNIEQDSMMTLQNYLPSASTIEIIKRFAKGLNGAKSGRMLSITGPYGSGKSTMAVFLHSLFSGKDSKEWKAAYRILKTTSPYVAKLLQKTREQSGSHKDGLIRCSVTAGREPITATILRALDHGATEYFGKYSKSDFAMAKTLRQKIRDLKNNKIVSPNEVIDIIVDIAKHTPVVIMIDEFGKNIEYFTAEHTQESDLFLLQSLAEKSGPGREIPLSIITLQHMAFEEYAVGASTARKQEWAKIQGRFEDIPFANSPDQTRLLISNTIKLGKSIKYKREVKAWAEGEAKRMRDLGINSGFDADLIASCYPLGPLALEVLPELCSRYGQYERTLLAFISDAKQHTVATFINENSWNSNLPPTIGIDMLYDYFISGTNMNNSSSQNITRLMEIVTIIRDVHGLNNLELVTLKTIGILNLIGRAGYLRASRGILGHVVGKQVTQILDRLEKRSIITYRKYADEYRIWHGTDIDIAAKLDIHRKRYQRSLLSDMLQEVLDLKPVVAARHGIERGTIRMFEQSFTATPDIRLDDSYDGIIIYNTGRKPIEFKCNRPIITVTAKDTSDLRHKAIEVMAIRDILANSNDVTSDWVARRELEERLTDAEVNLDRAFDRTYGTDATWLYLDEKKQGTPSEIVSTVCDVAYIRTPPIYNEMINRTILSPQGSAAKRNLLEHMIVHEDKDIFGLEGYGPDRAVYEAIFAQNKIHIKTKGGWRLQHPTKSLVCPVWIEMMEMIKKSKNRVSLSDIYHICKMPPYGMKDGVMAIFMTSILRIYRDSIAIYEHGTYVTHLTIEVVERMIKNPDHFEVKYFKSTPAKRALIKTIASDFKIRSEGDVLSVVSHLVRTVSTLQPYVKQTKNLDKNTLAVRDTILNAIEPDTLLFESLPTALGFNPFGSKASQKDIKKFSHMLVKSTTMLQKEFLKMIQDIKTLLFDATGVDNRKKLSKTSSVMLQSVTDQKMKVFLTALSSDVLEKDEDWINYVALSLTDVPPISWKDDQRDMFENNLVVMARKFKRLASIHFASISDNFVKPSYQVTVTHADGREHHNVVSLRPSQRKRIERMANRILAGMKKNKLGDRELEALIAILSSRAR